MAGKNTGLLSQCLGGIHRCAAVWRLKNNQTGIDDSRDNEPAIGKQCGKIGAWVGLQENPTADHDLSMGFLIARDGPSTTALLKHVAGGMWFAKMDTARLIIGRRNNGAK